jgi:hypothetical protein
MKKSIMITATALLVLGGAGAAYAQSSDRPIHHRWTHARETMAPYANSMAFAPGGGYDRFPGAIGDLAGNDANSAGGANSAGSNAEGRTGG